MIIHDANNSFYCKWNLYNHNEVSNNVFLFMNTKKKGKILLSYILNSTKEQKLIGKKVVFKIYIRITLNYKIKIFKLWLNKWRIEINLQSKNWLFHKLNSSWYYSTILLWLCFLQVFIVPSYFDFFSYVFGCFVVLF